MQRHSGSPLVTTDACNYKHGPLFWKSNNGFKASCNLVPRLFSPCFSLEEETLVNAGHQGLFIICVNVTLVTPFIKCKTKITYINKYYPQVLPTSIYQGLFLQRGAYRREPGYEVELYGNLNSRIANLIKRYNKLRYINYRIN